MSKVFIIDTLYPDYFEEIYHSYSELSQKSFKQQFQFLMEDKFSSADYYLKGFSKVADDVFQTEANVFELQKSWMEEHNLKIRNSQNKLKNYALGKLNGLMFKFGRNLDIKKDLWIFECLEAQIANFKPELIYTFDPFILSSQQFIEIKKKYNVPIVLQHAASPLNAEDWLGVFDLVVSSFPPTLKEFQGAGFKTIFSPLGFGALELLEDENVKRDLPLTFVGGIGRWHTSRLKWLEEIAERYPFFRVFSPDHANVPENSILQKNLERPVYGVEMFKTLQRSQITLNHHGDIPPYANNFRLFEATGMKSALITDYKDNLKDYFIEGEEVLSYRDNEDCLGKIEMLLNDEKLREEIAEKGQQRTLTDYNMFNIASKTLEDIKEVL